MLDEIQFRDRADEALNDLARRLASASERHDFEPDFRAGALAIEFDDPPAKFVISPNSPVRQIWVSAHSKSFKLDWDPGRAAFILPATGQTLADLISEAIGQQLGEDVTV